MHNNMILIEHDNYFICERLKELDRDYYVMFDIENNKYQLHCKGQFGNTYCLTFPFDDLDERAIFYTKKTSIENQEKIIEEIDKENKRLEKHLIKEEINKIKEALE